jgi:hypothetical protein
MTAVAIETSVLESLDFEISCQSTYNNVFTKQQIGVCDAPATHTATIHSLLDCQWIEKFLCEAHSKDYRDECWDCLTAPRIRDCKHLGTPS